MPVGREIIEAGEIPGYLSDETFQSALDVYMDYCLFDSLPFAGGWAEQPAEIVDALKVFIETDRYYEETKRPKP